MTEEKPGLCKKCGEPIVFVKMASGKYNPVNVKPRLTIVTDNGKVVTGRTSHFATCPNANDFREVKDESNRG